MTGLELAWIVFSVFAAAFVKGVTGLGFSTVCLALLVTVVGLADSLPLVIVPSLASNALVMIDAGGFRPTLARFWPLYLALPPGMAAGLWLLADDGAGLGTLVLGLVLTGYAAFGLARPGLRLPPGWERPLAAPVGLLTGVVNGLTGSQIMPILPYLFALPLAPARFVQAINISFTLCSLIMAAGLARIGLMTWEAAAISLVGLLPMALGVRLGGRLRDRLSPEAFRRAVLALLLVLGAQLAVRAAA
jgi:hypothetical protein